MLISVGLKEPRAAKRESTFLLSTLLDTPSVQVIGIALRKLTRHRLCSVNILTTSHAHRELGRPNVLRRVQRSLGLRSHWHRLLHLRLNRRLRLPRSEGTRQLLQPLDLSDLLGLDLALDLHIGLVVRQPGLAPMELGGVLIDGDHVELSSQTPNDI